MIQFFTQHVSEIASFVAIVGTLWAIISYGYRKLDKKIDIALQKIDAQGERIDAMGHRIDTMGHRIDTIGHRIDAMGIRIDLLYTVMMTMLEKKKD
jgi:hypothetical protein